MTGLDTKQNNFPIKHFLDLTITALSCRRVKIESNNVDAFFGISNLYQICHYLCFRISVVLLFILSSKFLKRAQILPIVLNGTILNEYEFNEILTYKSSH